MEQLNLQSIRVDFLKKECTSRYEDKIYFIPNYLLGILDDLKPQFESAFNLQIEQAVVQLTVDQYGEGADPRIWTKHGEEEGHQFTNMVVISTDHPLLMEELRATRVIIEAEITNQIGE